MRPHEFVGSPGCYTLLFSCVGCGIRAGVAVADPGVVVPSLCRTCAASHRALASCLSAFSTSVFTREPAPKASL